MSSPSIYHSDISMQMSRGTNKSEFQFDRNVTRNPDSVITIFTVNPLPLYSTSAGIKFAGKKEGERYTKVASINDPKYYVDDLSIEGGVKKNVTADDGRWIAMDWLNPANVYKLDQDYQVENTVEDGTNLLSRGMFFIVRPYDPINGNMDDKPTEAEIAPAEKRLWDRYNALARIYQTTATSNPAALANLRGEEMVAALNYVGLETPFNTTGKVPCPNCGDKIKPGQKYHRSESLGVICVQATVEGWKAAVAAGIKTRAEAADAGFTWPGRPASA